MIVYTPRADEVRAERLRGFFVGWPSPPTPEAHARILRGSAHAWLAVDEGTGNVVGFITAIADGVLSAYIPLLEVLPAYQGCGIGAELVRRMLGTLSGYYMVDLLCDAELVGYYERLGMREARGCCLRNYARQGGMPEGE